MQIPCNLFVREVKAALHKQTIPPPLHFFFFFEDFFSVCSLVRTWSGYLRS